MFYRNRETQIARNRETEVATERTLDILSVRNWLVLPLVHALEMASGTLTARA